MPGSWAVAVRLAARRTVRRHWTPVGPGVLRADAHGGVLLTEALELPPGQVPAFWFQVPLPEATAFWDAWLRGGSDPQSPELSPWLQLARPPKATPEGVFTTRRGRVLRYRAPGTHFGDPLRGS